MFRKDFLLILSAFVSSALLMVTPKIFANNLPLDKLTLPDGFIIEIFSDQVPNARQLALGSKGTVFAGSRKEGKVYAILDTDNDFHADQVYVLAKDLYMPSGIAFREGSLYVAEVNRILRFDGIEAKLSKPPKPVVITDKLPDKSHHGWKNISFGPDNYLYVPIGVPCNSCLEENPIFGTILRMNPKTGDWTIYAHGIRNSVGQAWHPLTGELWFTDNGRDWWGDDKPPCEINHATKSGQHFGFPFFHGDNLIDADYHANKKPEAYTKPALNLRAHVAPLGILFYTGDMFPKRYKNQIIYAEHGSWNRSSPIGYRLATVFLENNTVTKTEDFVSGWLQNGKPWGRPVSLIQLTDGSLLVSDDHSGTLYRISYNTPSRI